MWLELKDGSFVNLGGAVRAYDTRGRFCVILGDAPGHELYLTGEDADKARQVFLQESQRLSDRLNCHQGIRRKPAEDVPASQRPPLS